MPQSARPHLSSTSRLGARRAEILMLLRHQIETVAALATELGLTRNAVRSHLLALEKEGLVTRKGLQPGKRRPHEVYQLTRRAGEMLVHPSDAAFSAILTALKRALPPQQFKDLLGGGGAALAERFIAGDPARPLARRVRTAARLLRTLGGAPAVEERESGFCIRSRACPLAAVVAEHPETCQLVEQLLGHVIRAPVSEHCLRNGKSQCRFEVARNEG